MANCLGLYVQNNIIKYAKVSKEHDNLKIDSFGVKFYDNLDKAIEQVIKETYSYKSAISVNLSDETYNYFNLFALMNKSDLSKAIKTEFESYCAEKGYNPNVFESRYAIVPNNDDKEKVKVIYISDNKNELNKKTQMFSNYKLTNISPISMSIPNLTKFEPKENALIVNIEDKTTITTILDQKVYDVTTLEEGSEDILRKINLIENSYSKSYEICKNTTIYTSEGKDLQDADTSYLEYIMPTLYTIVGGVRKIINESLAKISKVYITGTAALINNIDLYFQEYLTEVNCEILKPDFVKNTGEINIKDYIEVNSAISLALMGLNEGMAGMNFKNLSFTEKLPDWLKIEVNPGKTKKEQRNSGRFLTFDLDQAFDKTETNLLRLSIGLLILVIVYSGFSSLLNGQMNKKEDEARQSISDTNSQIALANADDNKIKSKTNEYTQMIKNLQDLNDKISETNKTKNAIPNLLGQIMFIIPENVQITSIQNTSGNHIEINAQSNKYEQLGYLKAKIKTDNILTNVISTTGQKENSVITVKIEGDLP